MKKYSSNIPIGTRDILFGRCDTLRGLESGLARLFNSHGYGEMRSPAIEYYDTFLRAGTTLDETNTYTLTDRDGRILALRPDSTTPVARVFATKLREHTLPRRIFYIQNVFRSGEKHTGSNSETLQAGAELIGADGIKSDSEIVALAIEALKTCGKDGFTIELGHAGLFLALCDELTDDEDIREEIRSVTEKKNFAALVDVLERFEDAPAAGALKKLISMFGGAEVLDEAGRLSSAGRAQECVSYLARLYEVLSAAGFERHIRFDMGLVHEINYYTGLVFQGFVEGVGEPVISGGRYDRLTGAFGAPQPATGFGLNLDAVAASLPDAEHGEKKPAVIHYNDGLLGKALEYIRENEAQGPFELSPFETEAESRSYAERRGVELIIIE